MGVIVLRDQLVLPLKVLIYILLFQYQLLHFLYTVGKVSLKALSKRNKRELNRDQRRHQSTQLRQKKREEVLAKKRSLGGMDMAPIFVSVIPLNKEFDPTTALSILTQCDEEIVAKTTSTGVTHLWYVIDSNLLQYISICNMFQFK